MGVTEPTIADSMHPEYMEYCADWCKFRLVAEGGKAFISTYLKMFGAQENVQDFEARKALSYNPGDAAAAVREVKNAIFQRLVDVRRDGGEATYRKAIATNVDFENRSVNAFLGEKVLPDLLNIGKVGVFVDMQVIPEGASQADTLDARPYLYIYEAEDIRNWKMAADDVNGRFERVLLRNSEEVLDAFSLPKGTEDVFKLFERTPEGVLLTVYDAAGIKKSSTLLGITEIPLVIFDLEDSLLQDVADYQIAMLQLASSDINFLFKSNFPIYTEQTDPRSSSFIRQSPTLSTGTAEESRAGALPGSVDTAAGRQTRLLAQADIRNKDNDTVLGMSRGRTYPKDLDRPDFINPSAEPVNASMAKQKEMSEKIRMLVNLALSSLGASYASGASKESDNRGLEAGLSYIGLICERGEQEIARLWTMYVNKGSPEGAAKITYPTNYSLRSDSDRREEAKTLKELSGAVCSKTFNKTMQLRIASTLMLPRATEDELETVISEIMASEGPTSDPETLRQDVEAELVSRDTASRLRGYSGGEAAKAEDDHARRAKRIAEAQADAAAARGAGDVKGGGDNHTDMQTQKGQKDMGRGETGMNDSTADRSRGDAKG